MHLKNLLFARDSLVAAEKQKRWFSVVDADSRAQIKAVSLTVLRSPTAQAAHAGAQVVARIGAMELQTKQWPGLLEQLLVHMTMKYVVDRLPTHRMDF